MNNNQPNLSKEQFGYEILCRWGRAETTQQSGVGCAKIRPLEPKDSPVLGSQASLWAKFPAPPDDVTKMTVVIQHFIPLEDIPIGR
jgi:hypothetical protein